MMANEEQKEATGADYGISVDDQLELCLKAMFESVYGSASMAELYLALEAAMGGVKLSPQGQATLREIINRRAIGKGLVTKGDQSWQITDKGRKHVAGRLLELAGSVEQIQDNIRAYATDSNRDLVDLGLFFVYDTVSGWVAPCKFAAYRAMTVPRYKQLVKLNPNGFDGTVARVQAEKLLGPSVSAQDCPAGHRALAEVLKSRGHTPSQKLYVAGPEADREPVLSRFLAECRDPIVLRRGNVADGKRSLYKPTMLLSAMLTTAHGQATTWANLSERFHEIYKLMEIGPGKPAEPYPRLRNRGPDPNGPFWDILDSTGQQVTDLKDDVAAELEGTSVCWTGRRGECVKDARLRPFLVKSLLEYFTPDQRAKLRAKFPELVGAAYNYWVFQANPTQYRIDDAVSELDELLWVVRQHKDKIRQNDRVFIWRSGPDAALVAVATLLSAPAVQPQGAGGAYSLPGSVFSESEIRGRLRIDTRLNPPITRQQVLSQPILANLPVFKGQQGTNFPLTEEEADTLLSLIQGPSVTRTLASLAEELYLPTQFLETIELLLRDKRQVIFYGPPGTGKTYVARKLAEHLATVSGGQVEKVQFHPSYSYEDFIQGFRPRVRDGQTIFKLVNGPLIRLAKKAHQRPGSRNVLLIDEINRGNIAKVFGELYFLLEYRDEEIRLQYSARPFKLPKDEFWIIGTMNTADRSIALVDSALRRRFHFVPFFPDESPIRELLGRWLKANRPEMAWVAKLVDRVNCMLDNRHLSIGPSHFLRHDLDNNWLKLIWEYSVIPYLQEQFFGQEDRLSDFALHLLREPDEVDSELPSLNDSSTENDSH